MLGPNRFLHRFAGDSTAAAAKVSVTMTPNAYRAGAAATLDLPAGRPHLRCVALTG